MAPPSGVKYDSRRRQPGLRPTDTSASTRSSSPPPATEAPCPGQHDTCQYLCARLFIEWLYHDDDQLSQEERGRQGEERGGSDGGRGLSTGAGGRGPELVAQSVLDYILRRFTGPRQRVILSRLLSAAHLNCSLVSYDEELAEIIDVWNDGVSTFKTTGMRG